MLIAGLTIGIGGIVGSNFMDDIPKEVSTFLFSLSFLPFFSPFLFSLSFLPFFSPFLFLFLFLPSSLYSLFNLLFFLPFIFSHQGFRWIRNIPSFFRFYWCLCLWFVILPLFPLFFALSDLFSSLSLVLIISFGFGGLFGWQS